MLTVFEATKHHLDAFTESHAFPDGVERLVNEIAFGKCEDPLIAPRLWHSLSEGQKRRVRLSLQNRQLQTDAPPIIRITPADIDPITPDIFHGWD
jgi:hypothetical protein